MPATSYRHANRTDRRAIKRVARLVAGESPADARRRLMRERWMYGSRPTERRELVRRVCLRFVIRAAAALLPLALALAYLEGLRSAL